MATNPRRRSVRELFRLVFLGRSAPQITKEEFFEQRGLDEGVSYERQIRLMREQLVFEMERLREQFMKVGALITFFGLFFVYGLTGKPKAAIVAAVCIGSIFALYAQMPRYKALVNLVQPEDHLGVVLEIQDDRDELYYVYAWKARRQDTTAVAEFVLYVATVMAAIAVVGVLITAF